MKPHDIPLIVNYNHAVDLHNLDTIMQLYKPHFKQIIVYSDTTPDTRFNNISDVHYIRTHKGFFPQKIFTHFAENYPELLKSSPGVMVIQDDVLLNVPLLSEIDIKKVWYQQNDNKRKGHMHHILPSQDVDKYKNTTNYPWSWFRSPVGVSALKNVIADTHIQHITKGISDFVYIPTEYWTSDMLNFIDNTYKHGLFVEIALPTALANFVSPDFNCIKKYQHNKNLTLWGPSRDFDKEQLTNWIHNEKVLAIHPVKYRGTPEAKEWVIDLFC